MSERETSGVETGSNISESEVQKNFKITLRDFEIPAEIGALPAEEQRKAIASELRVAEVGEHNKRYPGRQTPEQTRAYFAGKELDPMYLEAADFVITSQRPAESLAAPEGTSDAERTPSSADEQEASESSALDHIIPAHREQIEAVVGSNEEGVALVYDLAIQAAGSREALNVDVLQAAAVMVRKADLARTRAESESPPAAPSEESSAEDHHAAPPEEPASASPETGSEPEQMPLTNPGGKLLDQLAGDSDAVRGHLMRRAQEIAKEESGTRVNVGHIRQALQELKATNERATGSIQAPGSPEEEQNWTSSKELEEMGEPVRGAILSAADNSLIDALLILQRTKENLEKLGTAPISELDEDERQEAIEQAHYELGREGKLLEKEEHAAERPAEAAGEETAGDATAPNPAEEPNVAYAPDPATKLKSDTRAEDDDIKLKPKTEVQPVPQSESARDAAVRKAVESRAGQRVIRFLDGVADRADRKRS